MGSGGGGIAAAGPGPLVLDDVAVIGNSVTPASDGFNQGGGGVYSTASLIVRHSRVANNTVTVAQSDGDSGGGGILEASGNGDLTVIDSVVSNNVADVSANTSGETTDNNGGGGIYMDAGNLTITGSTIAANTTNVTGSVQAGPADGGGGIYQYGRNFTLQSSTVSGNAAHGPGISKGGGGGVFDGGDTSAYLDSTIVGNSTDEPATAAAPDTDGGGGILLNSLRGGVVMANMTITGNRASAAAGGGINNNLSTDVQITNSIIAANTAGVGGANCDSEVTGTNAILSAGHNLSDDPASANSCALTAAGDLVGVAPLLGPLADNGGATQTEALMAGSPAIDAGDPAGCTDLVGNPISSDQRGVVRPQPPAGGCDIGAYERAVPAVATGPATVAGSAVLLTATVSDPDPRAGTVSFQYGPTTAYGTTSGSQALAGSTTAQPFTATVSGLAAGTYHYRATASAPDGQSDGSDGVFTVPAAVSVPAAPSVVTYPATKVGELVATLNGAVGPQGQATTVQFEYGTTGRLGTITPQQSIPAGSSSVVVQAALTGLAPQREYYARLVAVNATGTTDGSIVRFRTTARPRARRLTARVSPRRDHAPPFVYVISGKLALAPGITRAQGCRGTVRATATIGHAAVGSGRATVGRLCGYRIRLHLAGSRLRPAGQVRLTVGFAGNMDMLARSAAPLVVRYG